MIYFVFEYTYSEGTWPIVAMTCIQDRRGNIIRGVFCPEIPENENPAVNVQAKAKKQGFFYHFFPLIPEYLGRT